MHFTNVIHNNNQRLLRLAFLGLQLHFVYIVAILMSNWHLDTTIDFMMCGLDLVCPCSGLYENQDGYFTQNASLNKV